MSREELRRQLEQFVAKGGQIKVIGEGQRVTTDREIYLASRGLRPKAGSVEAIARRYLSEEEMGHLARAIRRAGQ